MFAHIANCHAVGMNQILLLLVLAVVLSSCCNCQVLLTPLHVKVVGSLLPLRDDCCTVPTFLGGWRSTAFVAIALEPDTRHVVYRFPRTLPRRVCLRNFLIVGAHL